MDSHLINSVVLWIDGSIIFATEVAATKVTKFNLKTIIISYPTLLL